MSKKQLVKCELIEEIVLRLQKEHGYKNSAVNEVIDILKRERKEIIRKCRKA